MLVKPASARAVLKPSTVASSAGWVTNWLMPILNAWVLSTLAAALGEALLDVASTAAPGGETDGGDRRHKYNDKEYLRNRTHHSPFDKPASAAF